MMTQRGYRNAVITRRERVLAYLPLQLPESPRGRKAALERRSVLPWGEQCLSPRDFLVLTSCTTASLVNQDQGLIESPCRPAVSLSGQKSLVCEYLGFTVNLNPGFLQDMDP